MPEDFQTVYERSKGKKTATYEETIAYYQALADKFDAIKLTTYGTTDIGKPIHLAVISKNKVFDPKRIKEQGKTILLINNAIHPGEPEGVDASMMLARDLMLMKEMNALLDNVVVCIIPMYNVGGALNRNNTSRANQNGPEEYGFRGNARNLDLNRDFIKSDSRNAQTFAEIFHTWSPDIFFDTHTSNGADYQHVMTLISTQKDKLNPIMSGYLQGTMMPFLNEAMHGMGFDMCPYVDPVRDIPDSGIVAFLETPRYSTGYTALFNTIGFMPETHMLKSFDERVKATYALLLSALKLMNEDHRKITGVRKRANEYSKSKTDFTLRWKLDKKTFSWIPFKGYAAQYKPSEVSGEDRLYYDQKKPFEKNIKFYDTYIPTLTVKKPYAYIIPAAWDKVVALLELNRVKVSRLKEDVSLDVETYYIDEYKTLKNPYEGHYLHYEVSIRKEMKKTTLHKGDHVVIVDQWTNQYIVEILEPESPDSYFCWNFFDPILQQKEWYSSYVFEEKAKELLKSDPDLKERFNKKKKEDPNFAMDSRAQLQFIYLNSPYYEKASHKRYPVVRVIEDTSLPLE